MSSLCAPYDDKHMYDDGHRITPPTSVQINLYPEISFKNSWVKVDRIPRPIL